MDSRVDCTSLELFISEVKKAITLQIKYTLSSDCSCKRAEKDREANQEKHEDGTSSIELYIFT